MILLILTFMYPLQDFKQYCFKRDRKPKEQIGLFYFYFANNASPAAIIKMAKIF